MAVHASVGWRAGDRARARLAALLSVGVALATGVTVGSVPASGRALSVSLPPASAKPAVDPVVAARTRASEVARSTGRRVAVEEMTTEQRRVWALPNGRFEGEISAGIARVKRDGRWTEVDLTLRRRADGTVAPAVHPVDLVLAGARPVGDHDLATMGTAGKRVGLSWSGRLPEPVLNGTRATYPDVYPGIDLVVEVLRKGYEQTLVVKDRAALTQIVAAQAALKLRGPGARSDGAGGLEFTDGAGAVIGRTEEPVMWDAMVDERTGEPKNVVRAGLTGAGRDFVVTTDTAWLTDPARRFPITIDPNDQLWDAGLDTYVTSQYKTSSYSNSPELQIGTQNSGTYKRISYVNINASGLTGATIHYANLKLWATVSTGGCGEGSWQIFGAQTNAYSGTTWNGRPYLIDKYGNYIGQDGNGQPFGTSWTPYQGQCTGQWVDSDVAPLMQYAVDPIRGWAQFTAVLVPAADGTNAYFKKFKSENSGTTPHVILGWSWPPTLSSRDTTPTTSCVTGAGRPVMPTAAPRLAATFAQSEYPNFTTTFEWQTAGGGTRTASVSATNNNAASVAVPPGDFVDGGVYAWRVSAASSMGVSSGWSSYCEFTVDTWAPPVAGCPTGSTTVGDFNGDGTRDVVIADPIANAAGQWAAGQLTIVDGSSQGRTMIDQGLPEVPGDPAPLDQFGRSIAVLDANSDGCADLAIGIPTKDAGGLSDSGAVTVLYGAPSGLGKGPAAEWFEQGVNRIPGAKAGGDHFGYSLAAGKTAAGEPFLIIGAPGEDADGKVDSGSVTYIRAEHKIAFDQTSLGGIGDGAELDDRGGWALAASPYHFAVSYPGEDTFAGRVCLFTHTITNDKPGVVTCVDQNSTGVTGDMEAGDSFGKSIAMAPYRGPGAPAGQPDSILVVGAPGEDISVTSDTGIVHQLHVTGNAATEVGWVSQDTAGISSGNESGDLFGEKVAVVNTKPADVVSAQTLLVAVGAPGEDLVNNTVVDAGAVHVFPGGTATVASDVWLKREGGPVPGTPAANELIGIALAATPDALLVASPYQAQKAVDEILWTVLASGSGTPNRSWPATGSAVAFGAQVG